MSRKITRWTTNPTTTVPRITCATVRHISHTIEQLNLTLSIVWSNFEIADMDFWRGEVYSKFYEYLESKGGFYYEVRGQRTSLCV